MAVDRLTAPWLLRILKDQFPNGVARRTLLDRFASLLVTPKSARGAKGRVARRLYTRLALLQRKGLIEVADGVVRLLDGAPRPTKATSPTLSALLRRKLFQALLVEDREPAEGRARELRAARQAFLAQALEDGWSIQRAAEQVGISALDATRLMAPGPK